MTRPIVPFSRVKHGVGATLLVISDGTTTLYLTDNNEQISYTYGGQSRTFIPYFFKFEAPEDTADNDGTATLTVGSVDQQLIDIVRSIAPSTPPTVEVIAVWIENWENEPVYSELSGYKFVVAGVDWNASTMSLTLGLDNLLNYDIPCDKFTTANDEGATQ